MSENLLHWLQITPVHTLPENVHFKNHFLITQQGDKNPTHIIALDIINVILFPTPLWNGISIDDHYKIAWCRIYYSSWCERMPALRGPAPDLSAVEDLKQFSTNVGNIHNHYQLFNFLFYLKRNPAWIETSWFIILLLMWIIYFNYFMFPEEKSFMKLRQNEN